MCITRTQSDTRCISGCVGHCNTLQHTATHCNTRQRTATYGNAHGCNTLQINTNTIWHVHVGFYSTLQRTATHCSAPQRTATHCNTSCKVHLCMLLITVCNTHTIWHLGFYDTLQHTATNCNTLKHTLTHCNKLQYTTTSTQCMNGLMVHCSTLQHTLGCNTLQHQHKPKQHQHKYKHNLIRGAYTHCYSAVENAWKLCTRAFSRSLVRARVLFWFVLCLYLPPSLPSSLSLRALCYSKLMEWPAAKTDCDKVCMCVAVIVLWCVAVWCRNCIFVSRKPRHRASSVTATQSRQVRLWWCLTCLSLSSPPPLSHPSMLSHPGVVNYAELCASSREAWQLLCNAQGGDKGDGWL